MNALEKKAKHSQSQTICNHPPHRDVDGGVPSTPTAGRLSRRDNNVLHLLCHARLTAARMARGSDLRPAMKKQVSYQERRFGGGGCSQHGGVHCQLRIVEQWQPVKNDLDSSIIRSAQGKQIQIMYKRLELQPRGKSGRLQAR